MASNNLVVSDNFLLRFGYYFNIFAGNEKIHTNMLIILKCMRTRICLLHFWKFLKRVSAEKIFIEFKVYKSESQAIEMQVTHILQYFFPILLRKKILQPKKRLISQLKYLLVVNRNDYLVSWHMKLFTGFE